MWGGGRGLDTPTKTQMGSREGLKKMVPDSSPPTPPRLPTADDINLAYARNRVSCRCFSNSDLFDSKFSSSSCEQQSKLPVNEIYAHHG